LDAEASAHGLLVRASRAVRTLACGTLRTDAPALRPRVAGHFLCLAKESNQRKARQRRRPLRGCPALLAPSGVENGLKHVFADYPARLCAARRRRWQLSQLLDPHPTLSLSRERVKSTNHSEPARSRYSLSPEGRGLGRGAWLDLPAIEAAEQRSRGGGFRRKSALALFRRPPRRAAQGSRVAAGIVGAPFFAYFLWQDKESRWPAAAMKRQGSNEGRFTPERAQRATNHLRHATVSPHPASAANSRMPQWAASKC
jgi:hypothetical protein